MKIWCRDAAVELGVAWWPDPNLWRHTNSYHDLSTTQISLRPSESSLLGNMDQLIEFHADSETR